jgi:hypothetical protein
MYSLGEHIHFFVQFQTAFQKLRVPVDMENPPEQNGSFVPSAPNPFDSFQFFFVEHIFLSDFFACCKPDIGRKNFDNGSVRISDQKIDIVPAGLFDLGDAIDMFLFILV